MEQDILTCIKDAHGNHVFSSLFRLGLVHNFLPQVIQKLVEVVPPNRLTFLPLICENILALSTHPYGCRVLQRCLEHLPDTHTRALLQAIHVCTLELMQDQYGVSFLIVNVYFRSYNHHRTMLFNSLSSKDESTTRSLLYHKFKAT